MTTVLLRFEFFILEIKDSLERPIQFRASKRYHHRNVNCDNRFVKGHWVHKAKVDTSISLDTCDLFSITCRK